MSFLNRLHLHPDYIRSTIFGIEDALVSTTGVIAGVSFGGSEREFIVLAALVTVAVEALSMGAGQYLSEEAVHQMEGKNHTDNLIFGATFMFFGYLLAGMIPVIPLLIFPSEWALQSSLTFAFIGLFLLGYIKGKIVHAPALKSAVKILLVGGLATLIGAAVGVIFNTVH